MKAFTASLALFVASTLAQLTINTPSSVVFCEPTLLNWSGGTAPYYLSVLPGNSPTGPAIENLVVTNSTSYTWLCNIESGTYIGFTLRDGSGSIAQSAALSVSQGLASSCANSTSVAGSSPTGAPTSSPSTGTITTGSSSPSTTGGGSASPSSTTPKSSNGASANVAQLGAAGIAGVAIAALFF